MFNKTEDDTNVDPDEESLLTTTDNPFSPFTEFDDWYAFDEAHEYHTCGYLARIARSSDDLSDSSQAFAIAAAINEIVELNLSGKHIKVTESHYSKPESIV